MPMPVICAGYSRTGTSSLRLALSLIGFGPPYAFPQALASPRAMKLWLDAFDGLPVDWDKSLDGFSSVSDIPCFLFYKELAEHFPSAKVILTMRDTESLFISTNTILTPSHISVLKEFPTWSLVSRCHIAAYGHRIDDRTEFGRRYDHHNDQVKNSISPDRLLVYHVSDGWFPLCDFLGVPVPKVPMPSVNAKEEWPEPSKLRLILEAIHVSGWGARGLSSSRV